MSAPHRPEESPARLAPPESEDYYMENGFIVFTESFHRKRGFCCNSGCRHCPWRDRNGLVTTQLAGQ